MKQKDKVKYRTSIKPPHEHTHTQRQRETETRRIQNRKQKQNHQIAAGRSPRFIEKAAIGLTPRHLPILRAFPRGAATMIHQGFTRFWCFFCGFSVVQSLGEVWTCWVLLRVCHVRVHFGLSRAADGSIG